MLDPEFWGLTPPPCGATSRTGIQIAPVAARNAMAVVKGLDLAGYKGKTIVIEDMDPPTALKVSR